MKKSTAINIISFQIKVSTILQLGRNPYTKEMLVNVELIKQNNITGLN
jgi:hypothetical protein